MKKAISFFIIATLIYLVCLGLTSLLFSDAAYKTSGFIAIAAGFIFLLAPLETLQFFGFFPKIPFYIMQALTTVIVGLLIIVVCLLEIFSPVYLGIILINALSLPAFSYMIGIIIYLTIWIALRKQYVKLISKTWDNGGKLIEELVRPLVDILKDIDKFVLNVYEMVIDKE
ncbi:MAG: hypothetical protein AB1432_11450 [Bacteroidota bacterium]